MKYEEAELWKHIAVCITVIMIAIAVTAAATIYSVQELKVENDKLRQQCGQEQAK